MDFDEISSVEHSPIQESHLITDEDLVRQDGSEQKYDIDTPDREGRADFTAVNAFDLIQVDVHPHGYVSATVGSFILGKLMRENESDYKEQEMTEGSVVKYLCSLQTSSLKILPVSSHSDYPNSLPLEVTTNYSLLFHNVLDGSLGISVEFVRLPFEGFSGWGLQIQSIGEESVNKLCFRLGDIIISVNGTCLVEMEKKSAFILLSSSQKRRLVVLRGRSVQLNQNMPQNLKPVSPETVEEASKKLRISSSELRSSSKFVNGLEIGTENENSLYSKNWKSIRSHFMCKTFYHKRNIRNYDENNLEYLPKYQFVSDLKTAVAYGHNPYKEFALKSVESKINVENY
jgi:hypothetical protein